MRTLLEPLHPGFDPGRACTEEWEPKDYYNRKSLHDSEAVAPLCLLACVLITLGVTILDLIK